MTSQKQFKEFLDQLMVMEVIDVLGLAKIFKVQLVEVEDGESTPRPADQILSDIIDGFQNLNRKGRRDLLRVIREANRTKIPQKNL